MRPIRHANEYWDKYGIAVHDDLVQPADLIFFSRNGQFPTHIGIVRDEETFIHSPGTDKTSVCIEALELEPIKSKRSEGLIYSRNPIGFKAPVHTVVQPTYRYHQSAIS